MQLLLARPSTGLEEVIDKDAPNETLFWRELRDGIEGFGSNFLTLSSSKSLPVGTDFRAAERLSRRLNEFIVSVDLPEPIDRTAIGDLGEIGKEGPIRVEGRIGLALIVNL